MVVSWSVYGSLDVEGVRHLWNCFLLYHAYHLNHRIGVPCAEIPLSRNTALASGSSLVSVSRSLPLAVRITALRSLSVSGAGARFPSRTSAEDGAHVVYLTESTRRSLLALLYKSIENKLVL